MLRPWGPVILCSVVLNFSMYKYAMAWNLRNETPLTEKKIERSYYFLFLVASTKKICQTCTNHFIQVVVKSSWPSLVHGFYLLQIPTLCIWNWRYQVYTHPCIFHVTEKELTWTIRISLKSQKSTKVSEIFNLSQASTYR